MDDLLPFSLNTPVFITVTKYTLSWQVRYIIMTEIVILVDTSSILKPWCHELQKLQASKVVKFWRKQLSKKKGW